MYDEEYAASAAGAAAKVGLLKNNPLGYFLLSALAGAYIGFGVLLAFTVSGTLGPIPMNKIAMGLSFGVASVWSLWPGPNCLPETPSSFSAVGAVRPFL